MVAVGHGAVQHHAFGGEFIDVRRLTYLVSITTERVGPKIVGDEEENVPDLGLGLSGAQANEASNDNKAGDHESESDGPWADCQGNPIDATS